MRTGQNSEIPAVRIDDFMNLIGKTYDYEIVRTRFFDKELHEL